MHAGNGQDIPEIPDYDLLRCIGRGSYGDVWLARSQTGHFRAVKIVWRDRFADALPYEREFKGLKQFSAISIAAPRQLALLHVGVNKPHDYFFYVMELADDANGAREFDPSTYVPLTLKEVRKRRGILPVKECLTLAIDLAQALSDLHSRGLIHRDIKPSNIIYVGGTPKLADIGLVSSTTEAATFVGTVGFIPPEGPGNPSADIFSLGKVLYELATGMDRNDYPSLPPKLNDLPDRKALLELNAVIIKACSQDPSGRYLDATALLQDLLLLQAGHSVSRLHSTERGLAIATRTAIILGFIAIVAGGGAFFERQRASQQSLLRQSAEQERDELARRMIYSGTLAQAQRALDQEDYGRARTLLQQVVPTPGEKDLRAVEWDLLNQRARGDSGVEIYAGNSSVSKIVLDVTERYLAALDSTATLSLIDLTTRNVIWTASGVRRLAGFTNDGARLIALQQSTNRFVRFGLDGSRQEFGEPIGDRDNLLGISSTNKIVVFSGTHDRSLDLYEPSEGSKVFTYPLLSTSAPWDLFRSAISTNGRRLHFYCISGRGTDASWRVVAYDLEAGLAVWDGTPPSFPTAVGVVGENGQFVLSVGTEGRVLRYDEIRRRWTDTVVVGDEINLMVECPGHAGSLLCAGAAPVPYEVSLTSASKSRRWKGHGGKVQSMVPTRSGASFYSADTQGAIRHWNFEDARHSVAAWDARGGVTSMVFSPAGDLLAVPKDGNSVKVVNSFNLAVSYEWPGMRQPISWNQDQLLTLAEDGGRIDVWALSNLSEPHLLRSFHFPDRAALMLPTASKDGKLVAAGDIAGHLGIWNTTTGLQAIQVKAHRDAPWSIAFSPDGGRLWSVGNDRSLTAVDTLTGKIVYQVGLQNTAPGLICTDDGTRLLVVLYDGRLEIRTAATGVLLKTRPVSPGLATTAQLSIDGKRLLIGGPAGSLDIVTPEGEPVVTLTNGWTSPLKQIAQSADGKWLALGSSTGFVTPVPVKQSY